MKQPGQVILGYALAFLALFLLIAGLIRIWGWANLNYVNRQVYFQETRLDVAGRGKENKDEVELYKKLKIEDEYLFEQESLSLPGEDGDAVGIQLAEQCCTECCQGAALPAECEEAGITCNEDPTACGSGSLYDASCSCHVKCVCDALASNQKQALVSQIEQRNEQIGKLNQSINEIRDAIEDCDDVWDFCWWVSAIAGMGFGGTAEELEQVKGLLQDARDDLKMGIVKASSMYKYLGACCKNSESYGEQQRCLDCVKEKMRGPCEELVEGFGERLQYQAISVYHSILQIDKWLKEIEERVKDGYYESNLNHPPDIANGPNKGALSQAMFVCEAHCERRCEVLREASKPFDIDWKCHPSPDRGRPGYPDEECDWYPPLEELDEDQREVWEEWREDTKECRKECLGLPTAAFDWYWPHHKIYNNDQPYPDYPSEARDLFAWFSPREVMQRYQTSCEAKLKQFIDSDHWDPSDCFASCLVGIRDQACQAFPAWYNAGGAASMLEAGSLSLQDENGDYLRNKDDEIIKKEINSWRDVVYYTEKGRWEWYKYDYYYRYSPFTGPPDRGTVWRRNCESATLPIEEAAPADDYLVIRDTDHDLLLEEEEDELEWRTGLMVNWETDELPPVEDGSPPPQKKKDLYRRLKKKKRLVIQKLDRMKEAVGEAIIPSDCGGDPDCESFANSLDRDSLAQFPNRFGDACCLENYKERLGYLKKVYSAAMSTAVPFPDRPECAQSEGFDWLSSIMDGFQEVLDDLSDHLESWLSGEEPDWDQVSCDSILCSSSSLELLEEEEKELWERVDLGAVCVLSVSFPGPSLPSGGTQPAPPVATQSLPDIDYIEDYLTCQGYSQCNSPCDEGECSEGGTQEEWLYIDLGPFGVIKIPASSFSGDQEDSQEDPLYIDLGPFGTGKIPRQ